MKASLQTKSWKFVKLETIVDFNPKLKNLVNDDLEVSFIPMRCVEELTGKINLEIKKKFSEVKKGYTHFKNNDVIFAKITPCMENGKIAVVNNLHNEIGFGSTEFHVLRPQNSIEPKFIFYYLIQNNIRNKARAFMTGSAGQERVPLQFLKNLEIPLPSLPEQRIIIKKLDQMMTEIHKMELIINKIFSDIIKYENSIIKYGVMGHLTSNTKIYKVCDFKLDQSVKNIDKKYTTKIPENWSIKELGEISQMYVPMRDKPKSFGGNTPWLRIEDLNGKYASNSKSGQKVNDKIIHEMKLRVYPVGTVLCSCSATIGVCAITTMPLITNQTFIGIYPNEELYNEYLYYFMMSQTTNLKRIGYGTTIPYISRKKFEKFPILIPTFEEQKIIVQEIEKHLTTIENLKNIVIASKNKISSLKTNLLAHAFTDS